MTGEFRPSPAVTKLSDDQLGAALTAGAVGERWSERAAVGLLVAHAYWLGRGELRTAVEATLGLDEEVFARVVWDRVDIRGAIGSWSELSVLALACSLGGVPVDRPLSELLRGLDSTNTVRVLNAVWMTCTGRSLTRRQVS